MKTIETIAQGKNFAAVSVGEMAQLGEHKLVLAPGVEIPGKVFVGQSLQTTGAELSFQSFAPHSETGFVHTHKTHEELYLIIKGKGEFQVDGQLFPVTEGSVIKVSPEGKRSLRNAGDEAMVMICVQYKSDSFDASDAADGVILKEPVQW